jgi:hypothetical protein
MDGLLFRVMQAPRLIHADNRRVDHLHGGVVGASESVHDLSPDTGTNEAIVAGGIGAEADGQIVSWRPRLQDREDAVDDTTIVYPWHAARLVRQHRLDGSPLIVGEFVPHDSMLQVWELESRPGGQSQYALSQVLLVAMPPKADPLCSLCVLSVLTRAR